MSFYELHRFCLHEEAPEERLHPGPVWDRETWLLGLSSLLMVALLVTAWAGGELGIMSGTVEARYCVLDS